MNKQDFVPPPETQPWTRIDTYVTGLARQRSALRRIALEPRTEPERPQMLLSTIPFLAMLGIFGMLFFAIAALAWPQSRAQVQGAAAERELGKADKGWFQEAEKEFAKTPQAQRPGPA